MRSLVVLLVALCVVAYAMEGADWVPSALGNFEGRWGSGAFGVRSYGSPSPSLGLFGTVGWGSSA